MRGDVPFLHAQIHSLSLFKHTCAHTAILLFHQPPPQYTCAYVSCGLTPLVFISTMQRRVNSSYLLISD